MMPKVVGRPRLLPLLPFVLLLASCGAMSKEPDHAWQEGEVESPSDRVLWKVALQAISRMGFPLGADLDPASMYVMTGWKNELQPFSGDGYRLRAEVQMSAIERGRWKIEARVMKQTNEAIANTLDLRYAEWEWTEDDVETARILVQHIRSSMDPALDVGDPKKPRYSRSR